MLAPKFCGIYAFTGGGGWGRSDQPAAERAGEGPGAVPTWLPLCSCLSGSPRPPTGLAGPLGWGRAPGRAAPTSSRLGLTPHKGEDCSHGGAGAGKHKWPLCVCSQGRGLRRPSLPASRAGQRGSSPTLRWTPALPQPVGETDVGGHRQPLVLFCDSLPVTSHGGPCSLGPPSAFQGPAFPQGALTWDHRGRGQRLPTLLLCREGNRGPQMTFAEFTGPSRKMVRNADLDATQAAIRPPALSSSCCATSCK